jgi:hypothetical protein
LHDLHRAIWFWADELFPVGLMRDPWQDGHENEYITSWKCKQINNVKILKLEIKAWIQLPGNLQYFYRGKNHRCKWSSIVLLELLVFHSFSFGDNVVHNSWILRLLGEHYGWLAQSAYYLGNYKRGGIWTLSENRWERKLNYYIKPIDHGRITVVIHKTGRRINGGCNSFLSFIILVYKAEFRNCVGIAHHLTDVNQNQATN